MTWTETTLGEIAQLTIGRTPPRAEERYWTPDLERPFLTIADMDGAWVNPSREGVTAAAEEEKKARRIPAGSLLMSFKLTLGRVGYAARDLFPNEAIVAIEPTEEEIDRRFLGLWLSHLDLESHAGRAVKGKTLNRASLQALPVAFPPVTEQIRIVEVVEAVDGVRVAGELSAARCASLANALRDSTSWVETETYVSLGDVLQRVRRPHKASAIEVVREIGIRSHGKGVFLKEPVSGAQIGTKKIFCIEPGDLVINIVFGWEGAVAIASDDVAGHVGSHRFPTFRARDDRVLLEFIALWLLSPDGRRALADASPGSAGRNRTLNVPQLLEAEVPVPDRVAQRHVVLAEAAARGDAAAAIDYLHAVEVLRQRLLDDLLILRVAVPLPEAS